LSVVYSTSNAITYNGGMIRDGNSSLKYILTGEGRYVMNVMNGTTGTMEYNITDHLGNVRVVLNDSGEVIQSNDYYPFGMLMAQGGSSTNKYLYNGKEVQEQTGWLDYGARMYDASLGRWFNTDPKAEKYLNNSPYVFCGNNSLKYVDLTGEDYYLSIFLGRVVYVSGSENLFSQGLIHLGGDHMTYGDIQDALKTRNYEYVVDHREPGGFIVDTEKAYKAWAMMQIFSPDNIATILGLSSFSNSLPSLSHQVLSRSTGQASSVWNLPAFERGLKIEQMLGGNLPKNFPVIDRISGGIATSIKSMDLSAATYRKGNAVFSTLKKYLNALDKFTSARRLDADIVYGRSYFNKRLEVAMPKGTLLKGQMDQILRAMSYARDLNIELKIIFM